MGAMSTTYAPIGDRVRAHRTALNLSQADLAIAAGVSRSTVLRIEGGQLIPTVPTLAALADALQCGLDDLTRAPQ